MEFELWSSSDTQRHRFTRRQLFAAGILPEERTAPRQMTIAAAAITLAGERHTGLVRDLSASGIFLYTNFKPEPGDALEMLVRIPQEGSNFAALACTATVVRVEESGAGAAFGIAAAVVDGYQLLVDGKAVPGTNAFAQVSEHLRRRERRAA